MSLKNKFTRRKTMLISLLSLALNACNHPPYNDFKKDQPITKHVGYGTAVGAVVGASLGATFIGTVVGGSALAAYTLSKKNKRAIIENLQKEDIQFIEYGDTITLIVPTDHYYLFNSTKLNEICFLGLNNIVRLLEFYPESKIHVAAFTDNVGTKYHKRMLSQGQAETMITFLWANGIEAQRLSPEGLSDHCSIGDNRLVHGSAYNRRIEIQWSTSHEKSSDSPRVQGVMKN